MPFFRRARYTDPSMQSVAGMAQKPIDTYFRPFELPDTNTATITIQHRYCHLIYRMQTAPCIETATGAKWYLENASRSARTRPETWPYVKPLHDQLEALIAEWEALYGVIDTTRFDRLVSMSCGSDTLICGLTQHSILRAPPNDPRGAIQRFVADHMWWEKTVSSL